MKRFLTIIAATAVAAAITIPAVADSGSPADERATFETCLRTHGIPIPADLEGLAAKQWIAAHPDAAGLDDAFKACDAKPRDHAKEDGGAEQLRACLTTKGLTPPARLDELKPWVLEQFRTAAGKEALNACGLAEPEEKRAAEPAGPCGADKPAASASRAKRPKARVTPTT
jgi:hypothetical protein